MDKRLKKRGPSRAARVDFATYAGVTLAYAVMMILQAGGLVSRSLAGQLVPICCYVVMALSLNLTVGILGELSLGHAGFMSVGVFTGIVVSAQLADAAASVPLRLALALLAGALAAAAAGFVVGIPVLRLHGDYLAIVTLAFGEILKELIGCLLVGIDERGLHVLFNAKGDRQAADLGLSESGRVIIKGAQGAVDTETIASFTAGFLLIMVTLFIILNLIRSRAGRAIMAVRDNRIAAESLGVSPVRYKLMAFVLSAALAGSAGALYGLNFSSLSASKFSFNQSILVLVFVVLGGLGCMWGSILSAVVLTILPEALRQLEDYRMLIYAVVLIVVMLATNSRALHTLRERVRPGKREEDRP